MLISNAVLDTDSLTSLTCVPNSVQAGAHTTTPKKTIFKMAARSSNYHSGKIEPSIMKGVDSPDFDVI